MVLFAENLEINRPPLSLVEVVPQRHAARLRHDGRRGQHKRWLQLLRGQGLWWLPDHRLLHGVEELANLVQQAGQVLHLLRVAVHAPDLIEVLLEALFYRDGIFSGRAVGQVARLRALANGSLVLKSYRSAQLLLAVSLFDSLGLRQRHGLRVLRGTPRHPHQRLRGPWGA